MSPSVLSPMDIMAISSLISSTSSSLVMSFKRDAFKGMLLSKNRWVEKQMCQLKS
jgi:hypothetical protein